MVTQEVKKELIQKFGAGDKDSGSVQVQIAILTERIKNLTQHFSSNKQDHAGMRGLMKLIGRRRSLLRYLSNKDRDAYTKLIGELGIRK